MANPASLTVTDLTVNANVARPAGDAIDTNGMVPILAADLGGSTGRLVIEVTEDNVRALTVVIGHGDNPPAVREGLGDLSVSVVQAASRLIGPLESARFIQNDGRVEVTFTGTAGAATCHVRTYLLPKA